MEAVPKLAPCKHQLRLRMHHAMGVETEVMGRAQAIEVRMRHDLPGPLPRKVIQL